MSDAQPGTATVVAAQAGDQRALDDLVAGYLPLVYNVVGRALTGHGDVDDVVQETMLRVVNGLGQLRDPGSFRFVAGGHRHAAGARSRPPRRQDRRR